MFKKWQAITLWKRVLIGLALGAALGLLLHYGAGKDWAAKFTGNWFQPFGEGFIRLIQMLVIPLITTTIIAGVTSLGDPKKLGSIGIRAMVLFLLTTFFAVWLGLAMGTLFQPGKGVNYQQANAKDLESIESRLTTAKEASPSLKDQFLRIIPTNPVQSLAQGDVLPIIVFALLIGVGTLLIGEEGMPMRQFFESAARVVMKLTMLVMELAPLGVFALMVWVMGTNGISILNNLFWLALALYVSCVLQIVVVYGLILVKGIGRLPLIPFFKGILDAQGVAYSTSSSNATLPASITCAQQNLGVDKSVASSVLPLGATINMDGTSIYLGLIALFGAQATGIELSWGTYFNIALTATMVSVGVAGIPSASLLFAATVLTLIGLDQQQSALVVAFIFPFDRLLDMMRTLTNVTGDLAVTCVVGKWEGAIDEQVFAAPNKK